MDAFRGIPIEFSLNGLQIVPLNKKEKFKSPQYLIYETNIPEFFIKIFRHKDPDINEFFKNSSLAFVKELDRPGLNPVRILSTLKNPEPLFWGLLVESYPLTFRDMVGLSTHSFDFDIFRFALQVAAYLREFEARDLLLLHLTSDNVVCDASGNFQLANLDQDVSLFRKAGSKGREFLEDYVAEAQVSRKDSPLAPEIVEQLDFGTEALVWDLGVLLCKVFLGVFPKVDYSRRRVLLNFPKLDPSNRARKTLVELIKACLEYDKKRRQSVSGVIEQCQLALGAVGSLIDAIHRKFVASESASLVETRGKIGNLVPSARLRNDKALESLEVKKPQKSFADLPVKSLIKLILRGSSGMLDEAIREVLRLSWKEPTSIVESYTYIKEKLGAVLNSEVRTMKLLLFLYAFISKGSRNILIVSDRGPEPEASGSDRSTNPRVGGTNAVIFFLERVFGAYGSQSQNLIFRFGYFVLVKFSLHLDVRELVGNNFGLNKADIILHYKRVLRPSLFFKLYQYLAFVFFFFLSVRKYTHNYFQKYSVITLYREVKSVLGLLCNLLSILQFGLAVFGPEDSGLGSEKKRALGETLLQVVGNLDVVVKGMNIFVTQCVKSGFSVMSPFKIRRKIVEEFRRNQDKMEKELRDPLNFSLRRFTKFYLNTLVRMEDPHNFEEVPRQTKSPAEESRELKRDFLAILNSFSDSSADLKSMNLDLGRHVPKAKFWYEHQFKTSQKSSGHQPGTNQVLTSVLLERGPRQKRGGSSGRNGSSRKSEKKRPPSRFDRKGSKRKIAVSTRNIAVQVNLIKKEGSRELRSDRQNRKVDSKLLVAQSLTQSIQQKIGEDQKGAPGRVSESNLLKSQVDDVYYKTFNINKFLVKEFKGSLKAWVIPPEKLAFGKVIASGSTCSVFEGTYMKIPVAIKKLKTDVKVDEEALRKSDAKKEKTPKFLKELKREIGLLISLPNHPNLLTILGFNIHEEHVNIVTEFCHGGTMFDILYKRAHRVNLSFQQQVKILMDICRGMMFLHSLEKKVIHRDLKSLNIFISNPIRKNSLNFQIKIADFGLARNFDNDSEFVTKRMGTFHWMAPEIFSDHPYTTKTDVYAFAIIMWEVFAGRTPYYDLGKPEKIIKHVYYDDKRPSLADCKIPKPHEDAVKDLIRDNWQRHSENRMEFEQIYEELEKIWQKL